MEMTICREQDLFAKQSGPVRVFGSNPSVSANPPARDRMLGVIESYLP